MREAGEITRGKSKVRFETERDMTAQQWKNVNASMRLALKFLEGK